jgi:hypothetical protein
MIGFESSGSFSNTDSFLRRCMSDDIFSPAKKLAEEGVQRLKDATPKDSGITAELWDYEIVEEDGSTTIWWKNTNVVNGFNVAVGLQYGHATGTGGWVAGYDYINPALKPIFDKMADAVWKEVNKA